MVLKYFPTFTPPLEKMLGILKKANIATDINPTGKLQ
jgi:hypothetical protein